MSRKGVDFYYTRYFTLRFSKLSKTQKCAVSRFDNVILVKIDVIYSYKFENRRTADF